MSDSIYSSTVFIGYSQNDYFYNNAMSSGDPYAPNKEDCANLKDKVILCDHDNFRDTSFNCIQKEMCRNQELATSLSEQYQNNGGQQKFLDKKYSFNHTIMQSINLGIGICGIIYYIILRRRLNLQTSKNII